MCPSLSDCLRLSGYSVCLFGCMRCRNGCVTALAGSGLLGPQASPTLAVQLCACREAYCTTGYSPVSMEQVWSRCAVPQQRSWRVCTLHASWHPSG